MTLRGVLRRPKKNFREQTYGVARSKSAASLRRRGKHRGKRKAARRRCKKLSGDKAGRGPQMKVVNEENLVEFLEREFPDLRLTRW
jgi:hypothetical protein